MAVDISWTALLISYLCILIPILINVGYATRLVKPTLVAFLRMTLQLMALGLYLGFIFKQKTIRPSIFFGSSSWLRSLHIQ